MKKYSYPDTPFSKRKTRPVTRFKVIGERCSGTYYTQRLIEHNLDISHTEEYGHKHFWSKRREGYPKDLLLVMVVREPYSWLQSFYEKKWHLPDHFHKIDFRPFLQEPIYSIKDHNIPSISGEVGDEIMADRNFSTKGRYKDIFELRHQKLTFMFHEFPKMCSNMILIRLEDLQNDYQKVLKDLQWQFELEKKLESFEDLKHYKGNSTLPIYQKKDLWITDTDKKFITEKLDWTWEQVLNYRKIVM
jgi:hypothetical protein